jgi:acetyltransferase-like isoleucine patch superfamily enzyme
MIEFLKRLYRWIKFQFSINWVKTLYFNFKKFPLSIAFKLPVYFYGSVKFTSLKGNIKIDANIRRGMVGFGQQFEMGTRRKGSAELYLSGTFSVKGFVHIGKDCLVYIGDKAHFEVGNMGCLGSDVKVFCTNKIVLGNWARIAYQSQIVDTNFHRMLDTATKKPFPLSAPIFIGNYNSISNRSTIMPGTVTPNYCVVASNSVVNKDYTPLGNNILLGGIPAKLIKKNYSRDWEGEKELLEDFLILKK